MKLLEDRLSRHFRQYKDILTNRDWTAERTMQHGKLDKIYLEDGRNLVAAAHRTKDGKFERVLEVIKLG